MKNIIILSVFSLFIFGACTKGTTDVIANCEGVELPLGICAIESVGTYNLPAESQAFQPYFGSDERTEHTYVNSEGNIMLFGVEQRTSATTTATFPSADPCPNNATQRTGYCITFDEMNYRIVSQENPSSQLEMTISVYTKPDHINQTGENVGDFVEILRKTGTNELQLDFSIVVNQRTLSFDKTENQEFFETITLNDITFNDVHSNNISGLPINTFKYYYTKERGLVAFIDLANELWVLEN